ncbi:late histone H2B.L4-like [Carcharodon carcharias]|uniref:late histone H2B.L4-like n=1 Tax=Carcharodon carcharias TaxID=13397 RepID=UPI001B7EEBB1|nr:late histone H2B.L4-like [Carcharodon carcharias]
MPEVAAAAKGGASRSASKQWLPKVTKELPKKRRKSRKQSYSTCMYRVLTQIHPSTKAMKVMNSFVVDIFKCITFEALHLILYHKHHTISAREIQSAIHLVLPRELVKHTVSEGTRTVTKYTNSI